MLWEKLHFASDMSILCPMKILAIETSCDETACAIVENGTKVLANVIYSQIATHQKTGGVVPEVAAREHVHKILPAIDGAIEEAGLSWNEIDAIAVTKGPGLLTSLIVGTVSASTLANVFNKPIIPVNHIEGHLYAPFLGREEEIKFPILILTVSGGHNEIVLMKDHGEYEIIGETLDDAAGEAFDKVARILGLPYPGGPAISKVADNGNAQAIDFPRALNVKSNFDFSFSGLKTAALYAVNAEKERSGSLSETFIADCAASFQEAVCDSLSQKFIRAAIKFQPQEMQFTGGVSANKRLRSMMVEKMEKNGLKIPLHFPENLKYCTDNAAMIGAAAYHIWQKNPQSAAANMVLPDCSFELI